jgi:hypothetical protein
MKIYTDEEFKQLDYETFGGEIELTVKLVPSNKIKIEYYDHDGTLLDAKTTIDIVAKGWMFICHCPGVDERLIRRVEQPTLDYAYNDGLAMTKVYYHTVKRREDELK